MPSYLFLYLYLYCSLTQWRWTRVRHACWPCWGIWPVLRHSPTHASPRFVPVDIMIVATWCCDIMVILRHCDKEQENTNRSILFATFCSTQLALLQIWKLQLIAKTSHDFKDQEMKSRESYSQQCFPKPGYKLHAPT